MPQSKETRGAELARMAELLNTPDGKMLIDELRAQWDGFNLLGDTPQHTAYKVGQRDAYQLLSAIARGEFK